MDVNAAATAKPRGRDTLGSIPELRERWIDKISDLVGGVPPKLPPWRLINHQIKLIAPDKRINYHLPKCPDALKEELAEKISRYTSTGWWVPVTTKQAVLMLCILKKNGKLRTVFDLRMQNENTEKDVSPFPDQDTIRHDVACAAYRSKLDMSEVYEQIRVHDEDVPKTAFATIFGTFVSRVMQQGRNGHPARFFPRSKNCSPQLFELSCSPLLSNPLPPGT